MNRARFQRLVVEAIDSLPREVRERIEGVAVIVEDEPSDAQIESVGLDPAEESIYGLYEGTPLPDRGHDFAMQLPDRILLFRGPLERDYPHPADLRAEIRDTIIHEVAHFYGLDDDEIEDLGY